MALPFPIGYYYANSTRYGKYQREVAGYTNLYLDWAPEPAADQKVPLGKRLFIRLNLEDHEDLHFLLSRTTLDRLPQWDWQYAKVGAIIPEAIRLLRPVWSRIAMIELTDEPRWSAAQIDVQAREWNAAVRRAGLPEKPLTCSFTRNQILRGTRWKAAELDAIGIEAYLDYIPEKLVASQRRMQAMIDAQLTRIGPRRAVVLIAMAYDRNGTWRDPKTLVAVQSVIFRAARKLHAAGRLRALLLFSYARPGGTQWYPALKAEHQRLVAELR